MSGLKGLKDRPYEDYEDIIHLPHPDSPTRPRMSLLERAAQFSPFAALVGYEDAVRETERLTEGRLSLSQDMLDALDGKLCLLEALLPQRPTVSLTYFVEDAHKDGGAYRTKTGRPKKLDALRRVLVFEDGTEVALDDIVRMDGEIFQKLE